MTDTLLPQHRADLRASGLTDETILAAGLYSESNPKAVAKLLGWRDAARLGPCLCIPFGGGYVRVKPDQPRKPRGKGSPAKYESPKGQPNRAYIPLRTRAAIEDDTAPLIITEGEKKALCADQHGNPCIGLVGVWNFAVKREEDEDGRKIGDRQLIPDLAGVSWSQRPVYIAFDSDAVSKPGVQYAEWHLAKVLRRAGARVRVVRLPSGADGTKVGLDDFLITHGLKELDKLIAEARSPEKPVPADDDLSAVDDPHRLAAGFLASIDPSGKGRLRRWRDEWMLYQHGAYRPMPEGYIRGRLAEWCRAEFIRVAKRELAAWTGEGEQPRPRKVTARLLGDTLIALQGVTLLGYRVESPAWIGETPGPDPRGLISMRNGILDLERAAAVRDDALLKSTPDYFTEIALPYKYQPNAPEPVEWLRFLERLWPDDQESIGCLQDWFGYLTTQDTRLQKILLLIGPRRSGKGTIFRVLKELVGSDNTCGPTLGSLAGEFGEAPLLGKSVAMVSDARISGRTDSAAIAEKLLAISGEDTRTVNRKYRDQLTVKLPTRFIIASNELPRLGDNSGALAGRFIILRLTRSWYGVEDHHLTEKLLPELPGILQWALEGLRRLRERGRFVQPAGGADLAQHLEDLTSPAGQFIRERCVIESDARIEKDELYREWKLWCELNGKKEPGIVAHFARDLIAAVPTLTSRRPRTSEGRLHMFHGIRIRTSEDDRAESQAAGQGETPSGQGAGQGAGQGGNPLFLWDGQGGQGEYQTYAHTGKQQQEQRASAKSVEHTMQIHPDHPDHPDHPESSQSATGNGAWYLNQPLPPGGP